MGEQGTLKFGDKVRFAEEKTFYRVWAAGNRFVVCTRPYNPKRTTIYAVIDFERKVRGPENLVFGFGAETVQQCQEMLKRLESGETEVTYRNYLPLHIDEISVGKAAP